jgi:hypothetical protein
LAVYVDSVRFRFRGMVMCHMWADTDAELHRMAQRLGMRREWFQSPPKASWKHYDISLTSKRRALGFGAILTDRYGAVEHRARVTGDTKTLERIRVVRAKRRAGA